MPELFDPSKATLTELFAEQEGAAEASRVAKARTAAVAQELSARLGASAIAALDQAGKDHGSTSLPLQDGLTAKAEVKRDVKWDSAALMAVAQTLPWDRVEALFTIKFSMSETIYKGVSALDPELRAKIDAARTTEIATPKISLKKDA